jgi:hypothetical protein
MAIKSKLLDKLSINQLKDTANRNFLADYLKALENQNYINSKRICRDKVHLKKKSHLSRFKKKVFVYEENARRSKSA